MDDNLTIGPVGSSFQTTLTEDMVNSFSLANRYNMRISEGQPFVPPTMPIMFWKEIPFDLIAPAYSAILVEQLFTYNWPLEMKHTYRCSLTLNNVRQQKGASPPRSLLKYTLSGFDEQHPKHEFSCVSWLLSDNDQSSLTGEQSVSGERNLQQSNVLENVLPFVSPSFTHNWMNEFITCTGDSNQIHQRSSATNKQVVQRAIVPGLLMMGQVMVPHFAHLIRLNSYVKLFRARFVSPLFANDQIKIHSDWQRTTSSRSRLTFIGIPDNGQPDQCIHHLSGELVLDNAYLSQQENTS